MTKPSYGYYFAYGSNIDHAQMSQRCPEAVVFATARLSGYRFIINARGVATIVPQASSAVYGILWTITEADEQSLDNYEGMRWGTYKKMLVNVEVAAEQSFRALAYVASDSTPGSPRDNYIENILAAAAQYGLPDKYVEELTSWSKTGN